MLALIVCGCTATCFADGNRLTYLVDLDPYYVSRQFPKLTTPQWVGEPGVEAVVVLAIDDMRGHEKWEAYLRPILERLKKIDGRAPVSIMTCKIDPQDPHLQTWLREGLSLEVHTVDHPCPLLGKGDFARAKSTFDRCVEMLSAVPGNTPVAFRTPCCDSLNTVSPRFFAEIFNRTTPGGGFLALDSSVFVQLTPDDPALPRQLVFEPDGRDRFGKYVPRDRSFVNTIEDYPYPYVIGRMCWEFPCIVPSDWEAQYLQQPNNPKTVRDLKAALDAAVIKQGVLDFVFHPHGWIRNDQVIELIDHAVQKHGGKVKFLTFREAYDRLNAHLLGGHPLRAADGQDNGVRILDVNHDGYLDVVIGNDRALQTRLWSPNDEGWTTLEFPAALVRKTASGAVRDTGVRFGVLDKSGKACAVQLREDSLTVWQFDGGAWNERRGPNPLSAGGRAVVAVDPSTGGDRGVRLRDFDGDGICELLVSNDKQQAAFAYEPESGNWRRLPFTLPQGTQLVDAEGYDRGLRFVDVDDDGRDDVMFSNERRSSLHLFTSMDEGWSLEVHAGPRGEDSLPMIVRGKTNNGAWFHSRHLWVQNEDTDRLPNLVDRRSFNGLLERIEPRPKSPQASLRALKPRPGFQVELVAAEPLVMDPVGFDWGPDGKLWVAEMADYPLGLDDRGKPGGRIRYLEDTDGDGRYDRSTLFWEGLPFPSDVMPWRRGVLVTAAPNVWYAEDTDGDGRADLKRPLVTGFGEGNQQHRVNGLRWGLDNWVHLANGDSAGRIRSAETGQVIELGGRDLRIRPDEGLMDPQSGRTQHGRHRNDWGDWFGANNSNPGWHYVLADHYLRRNPHVATMDPRVSLTENRFIYPRGRPISHWEGYKPPAEGQPGRVTSACGHCSYRGELFPPPYRGNMFMSEAVHSLVHRMVLSPVGATYQARRGLDEADREFLASADSWFRPNTLKTGPDGALWVADMYRLVIEHPEWIDDRREKELFLRAGHDKGRIYRVYPVGAEPRPIPRLDALDTAGLVAVLESANGPQRDLAQAMLVWRADPAAVGPLERLAAGSSRPLARLHALCTLEGMKQLREPLLVRALNDPHPGVRRHALRLAEPFLAAKPSADLAAAVLARQNDSDRPVLLQLAYSLGAWDDPRAGRALGNLLLQQQADPYVTAAAMSSALPQLDQLLAAVLAAPQRPAALVDRLLALAVAVRNDRAVLRVLEVSDTKAPLARIQLLTTLLDALARRDTWFRKFHDDAGPELRARLDELTNVFAEARAAAADDDAPLPLRVAAARLLARDADQRQQDLAVLAGLLVPQSAPALQEEAVRSLGRLNDTSGAELMFALWKQHSPRLRELIIETLLARNPTTRMLLARIEAGELAPGELSAEARQRLLDHKFASVRSRARALFGRTTASERAELIARYRAAVPEGDAGRGEAVFKKICAKCHKLGSLGFAVGPDLTALTDRSAAAMLVAMLDPNRAVEAKYQNYTAALADGRVLTGMLVSETGGSITLAAGEDKRHEIPRAELEVLESSGKSLMPEGMEKELAPRDAADVIAFVQANGPPRKTFAGNNPELVRPDDNGVLKLLAVNCEIYGPDLVFEPKYGNLGYWTSPLDRAVWQAELPREATYEVWLDAACADSTAGNKFLLQTPREPLRGTVAGTGNWDTYRRVPLGRVTLPAGRQRLVFRSDGPIDKFLLDLRGLELVPVEAP